MPKRFLETPGERRCISCDQRLITEPASPPPLAGPTPQPAVSYVCPDDHERWVYESHARKWTQMY
jgi:hypothetical protein